MYSLLFELIDFFECNLNSECFLFPNLTITRLLSVVLLCPRGKWWQPLISARFIAMVEFLQIWITCFSRSSSGISFKIPDISILFLLLYCSALACNFSRLTIWFSRLTLTFLMIINSLMIFSFAAITWLRPSVSFSIWLQRSLKWLLFSQFAPQGLFSHTIIWHHFHSSWRFINIHVGKTKFNFFTLTSIMYASSLYGWHSSMC